MPKKEHFRPNWYEDVTPAGTYRSLIKWGDPAGIKHPNSGLVRLIMDKFHLTEADLSAPINLSLEPVEDNLPCRLPAEHLAFFRDLCGEENVRTDAYARISRSYGKGMLDALRLRRKIVENLPEIVVSPRSRDEIVRLVAYADEHRIPVTVFGGGSTVTRGMEATLGGICVDMSKHMNRVIAFNETDQTITVEAGMSGPKLEALLNNAVREFGAARAYTCGHFPQSFEYSSVGGWIVTRGAGQNSTYYGKIEDLVIAQDYVTPIGDFRTCPQPRAATGPDFDQVMMGGEGAFGILVSATLRVFRYMPENRKRFSYMFRNWEEAQAACREIMQAEIGFPSVFRLSDPEETDVAMKLYHIEGTAADALLQKFGYQPMQKCLFLGFTDGEKGFCANLDRKIRRICRKYHAFELSLFGVTKRWEKDRFRDPYLREDLQDFGVLIDTLECAVTWEQMPRVHAEVR
ncbi:MAG: FAD-binding protein, partial [Chloroflexi bacterium]|nr:FAD-binding protein [Chloroflexota bacterium]